MSKITMASAIFQPSRREWRHTQQAKIIHFSLGASLFSHPLALRSQLLADAVKGWAEAREALQMRRRKHVATRLPDYASHSP